MTINNISNTTTDQVLNISSKAQSENIDKLSTGFKVNRDDTAASMKLSVRSTAAKTENYESSMSDINDIDKIDEMIARAQKNILANPEEAVAAQANQAAGITATLIS